MKYVNSNFRSRRLCSGMHAWGAELNLTQMEGSIRYIIPEKVSEEYFQLPCRISIFVKGKASRGGYSAFTSDLSLKETNGAEEVFRLTGATVSLGIDLFYDEHTVHLIWDSSEKKELLRVKMETTRYYASEGYSYAWKMGIADQLTFGLLGLANTRKMIWQDLIYGKEILITKFEAGQMEEVMPKEK